MESRLGYLLSGPLPHGEPPSHTAMFHISTLPTENEEFNGLWSAPSTDVLKTPTNLYDQTVIENFKANGIPRSLDGTYCARFPWKTEHHPLRCLRKANKISSPSPWINSLNVQDIWWHHCRSRKERIYGTIISDQLTWMNALYSPSSCTEELWHHTCSHYIWLQLPSSTNVLNECLTSSRTSLHDKCAILLRFQTHPLAFSTDIEKAFLHVRLHEDDRDCTRFLWLSENDNPKAPFKCIDLNSRYSVLHDPHWCSAQHLNPTSTSITQKLLQIWNKICTLTTSNQVKTQKPTLYTTIKPHNV